MQPQYNHSGICIFYAWVVINYGVRLSGTKMHSENADWTEKLWKSCSNSEEKHQTVTKNIFL